MAALKVAVVLVLYGRYGYPLAEGAGLAVLVATLLAFGFVGTDSPLFLLLPGPLGAVFALSGTVEYYVRARRRDGSGGTGFGTEGGS